MSMGLMRVISISVLVAVLAFAVSCSGNGVSLNDEFQQWAAAQDFTTSLGTNANGLPNIPMDSGQPSRGVSTDAPDYTVILGADYLQKYNAEVDGTTLVLQAPAEDDSVDPALAYGLYQVSGLTDKRPTSMNIQCLPKLIDQPYYVGLADYTSGQWMWFGPIFIPEYELDLSAIHHQLVTQLGNMYFVLVSPPGCGATHSQTTVFLGAPANGDLPGAPHSLIASDGASSEWVGLVWEPGARANYYEVWRSGPGGEGQNPVDGQPGWYQIGQAEGCEYVDTAVTPGVIYAYKVRSINTAGCSEYSNVDTGYAGEQPPPPTDGFVIEGGITWPGTQGVPGEPVPGVHVTLLGLRDRIVQETNVDGRFRFANLPAGRYIVVPAEPSKIFDPWYRVVQVNQEVPVGHADFIARAEELACWRAWGFAYRFASNDAGAVGFQPLAGVVMTIAAGENTYTVQTNEDGYFERPELPVGPYSVTPGKEGYTFTPELADGNIDGQQMQPPMFFLGQAGDPPPPPASGVIEGHIFFSQDPAEQGTPVAGMPVQLLGLNLDPVVANTDEAGNFRFGDLPFGTYIVKPFGEHMYFDARYIRVTLSAEHPGAAMSFRGFEMPQGYNRLFGFIYDMIGEAPNHFRALGGTPVTLQRYEGDTPVGEPITVTANADGFWIAENLTLGAYKIIPTSGERHFIPEIGTATVTNTYFNPPKNFRGENNVP
jgi:hypothetical protein